MLTHEALVELYRELQDQTVLSVYLDADQHDPAQRTAWRKKLEQQIDVARAGIASEDGPAFESAAARLREEVEGVEAFLPGKGFVAFVTADRVRYAEAVPVPMPDLARWEAGIRVAPYVRGLKQERPVVLVLLDSRKARVFRYQDGGVEEVEDFRADTFLGDLGDMNVAKRGTRRSGVRGQTSTDAAQRFLAVSSERMVKQLMEAVARYVGENGFLVIGGTPERVSQAVGAVPKALDGRLEEAPSLHVDMTASDVRAALDRLASEMTQSYQQGLLSTVVDQARADGRASLGRRATERALREMRVDTLLLSHAFIEADPDAADPFVRAAFAGNARVEEFEGEGAARLDREGEGVAARLRFREPGERREPRARQRGGIGEEASAP